MYFIVAFSYIHCSYINFVFIKESKKKVLQVPKNNIKQRNSFNTIINQHIRMISEGSCDTEDCSNDAENSNF